MKKEKILQKLAQISALEAKIEKRMWDMSTETSDSTGTVLSEANIQQRVSDIADKIIETHPEGNPLLITIMDGALVFAALLYAELAKKNYVFQFSSMQASSYAGTTSGDLKIISRSKIPEGGRNVILVDEVCDTGRTVAGIAKLLKAEGALSVDVAVLVNKHQHRDSPEHHPAIYGVIVKPDAFVVGVGMDYEGLLRNQPSIRTVDLASLPTAEERLLLDQKKSLLAALKECLAKEQAVSLGTSKATLFAFDPEKVSSSAVSCIRHMYDPNFYPC